MKCNSQRQRPFDKTKLSLLWEFSLSELLFFILAKTDMAKTNPICKKKILLFGSPRQCLYFHTKRQTKYLFAFAIYVEKHVYHNKRNTFGLGGLHCTEENASCPEGRVLISTKILLRIFRFYSLCLKS